MSPPNPMGSPQNNFNTMQGPQPRNQMLGNALRNTSGAPTMMSPNQYGQPTPQMGNMQMPQSNVSFNLQPQLLGTNASNMNQNNPMTIGQSQGQNRFGVGLAKQQNAQVY